MVLVIPWGGEPSGAMGESRDVSWGLVRDLMTYREVWWEFG